MVQFLTHSVCANTQKPVEQIFELWFYFFGDFFLNFKLALSLWNKSSGAI